MFLPVNVHKFLTFKIFNFILVVIVNSSFESSRSRVFLLIGVHIRYTWGISVGDSFPSKVTGCRSAVLVEVGSFVGLSQVSCMFYYLFCKRLFLENCFWWLLQYFMDTFYFDLTWKESFLKSALCGRIFHKYLVFHQLFIKHQPCVANIERFPS